MGCCSSLNIVQPPQQLLQLPTQELTIRKNERESLFAKKPLQKIVESFKREGLQKQLSIPQLKRALHELGLNRSAMEEPDNPLFKYFTSFEDGKLLDLTKIITSAVLLSTSEIDKKLKVLFEEYKDNNDRLLKPGNLRKMVLDLFVVSLHHTPLLAIGEGPDKLSSEEISQYGESLSQEEDKYIEETYKVLLGNSEDLGIKELETAFSEHGEVSRILSSSGLREFILHKYKATINL
ncbi:unnamed protein product [Blepharisma stoltei]|uniref:Uncharacterized protein n=1 Tax=Blepharisma stoltei TaxID=1481888 RepID=A0AAU9ID84_9CILI|nr:unnamed protein product [Blepharisma stoltei]